VKLSPHFSLDEFEVSEKAARLGLDNSVPPELMGDLLYTARALEVVRQALGGRPVIITSGYRSPEVNAEVGGSKNSQHMKGRAADFIVPGFGRPLEVCRRILEAGIVFDQLIHEYGRWAHCSFVQSAARCAVLTIDRRGTRRGLHEARG
jgi:hypothetical protein